MSIGTPPKYVRMIDGKGQQAHYCQACKKIHIIPTMRDGYQYNFQPHSPTFDKSIFVVEEGGWLCHYSINAGVIYYHSDCSHDYRGKSLLVPPIDPETPVPFSANVWS